MPADRTILALIQTVFASILEVFIVCAAGYVLARRGILEPNTRKQLNRVNVALFTPCLLFSKVAFFLSPAKLRELWIVPIIFVALTITSMTVAWALGHIFRLKRSQRSFAMAAAMFMNTNSLPIALMQSLALTVKGLKWDADDSKDAMVGRALTYLAVHSTMGMILRWSFGVHLLSQADPESTVTPVVIPPTPALEAAAPDFGTAERPVYHSSSESVPSTSGLRPPPIRRDTSGIASNPAFFHSFPYIATQSQADSTPDRFSDSDTENEPLPIAWTKPARVQDDSDDDLPPPRGRMVITAPPTSRAHAFARHARRRVVRVVRSVNAFMTGPLWAALASLVVACAPPLQHLLEQHMQPLKGSISAAGSCSIPVTLVVLGAYFVPPPAVPGARRVAAASPPGETRTVVVALAARMLLVPALLLPIMYAFARFDLHEMFDDPVFVVSTVLVVTSPPAITLAQMTQQASGDAFERLISRTIFWGYCALTPPLTVLYVVLGLYLSRQ